MGALWRATMQPWAEALPPIRQVMPITMLRSDRSSRLWLGCIPNAPGKCPLGKRTGRRVVVRFVGFRDLVAGIRFGDHIFAAGDRAGWKNCAEGNGLSFSRRQWRHFDLL